MSESTIRIFAADLGFLDAFEDETFEHSRGLPMCPNGACGGGCSLNNK